MDNGRKICTSGPGSWSYGIELRNHSDKRPYVGYELFSQMAMVLDSSTKYIIQYSRTIIFDIQNGSEYYLQCSDLCHYPEYLQFVEQDTGGNHRVEKEIIMKLIYYTKHVNFGDALNPMVFNRFCRGNGSRHCGHGFR